MRKSPSSDVESQRRGAKARELHKRLESLVVESRKLAKMTAETWDALGQVLYAQRQTMNKRDWGAWLRAHGLNTGLLQTRSVISRLLFLAEPSVRADVQACTYYGATHPTEVYRRYLDSKKREHRYLGGSAPFADLLQELARATGQVEYWANQALREMALTKEQVSTIADYMQQAVTAHAQLVEAVAADPDALTFDPRPWIRGLQRADEDDPGPPPPPDDAKDFVEQARRWPRIWPRAASEMQEAKRRKR